MRLENPENVRLIACPWCKTETPKPATPEFWRVTVHQCPYCGELGWYRIGRDGECKAERFSPSIHAASGNHAAVPARWPLIWSRRSVVRVGLFAEGYDTERVPRTDDSGTPYIGYTVNDELVLCLYPPKLGDTLGGWGCAVCKCSGCGDKLEHFAWAHPQEAGEPPLAGLIVVDSRLKGRLRDQEAVDRMARTRRCAAAILVCRKCRTENVYFLKGKGQAGPTENLAAVLAQLEH